MLRYIAIALLIIGALLAIVGLAIMLIVRRRNSFGTAVDGVITEIIVKGGSANRKQSVRVSYTFNGEPYETVLSTALMKGRIAVGETLALGVDEKHPKRACCRRNGGFVIYYILGIICVIGGIVLLLLKQQ